MEHRRGNLSRLKILRYISITVYFAERIGTMTRRRRPILTESKSREIDEMIARDARTRTGGPS